ncbi:MAG: hypothetical protein RLZZ144_845 [Pseudomonadota bacterium]
MMLNRIFCATGKFLNRRITLSETAFVIAFSALNSIFYQLPLYAFVLDELDIFSMPAIINVVTLFATVMTVTVVAFLLLALMSKKLVKPFAIVVSFGNAIALFFVQTYQVVLDKSMMGNVFNTNMAEATSYFGLSLSLLMHLVIYGILPIWLISRVTLSTSSRLKTVSILVLSITLGMAWIYTNSQSWLWIDKNASKLGGMIMPWSYVINAARYQSEKVMQTRTLELLPDAHFIASGKTVVVLVIGESARSANFSLYGYQNQTNPELEKLGVVALRDAHSCATYTTASIQCMLAHVDTSSKLIHNQEALPSYLQRSGVDVTWISNNWGEPPLKIGTYLKADEVRKECQGSHCQYDEVMLTGLKNRIDHSSGDKVFIVLHQSGSHGPDYYNHYTAEFEKFSPVCHSVNIRECTTEELIRAYDNTIVYTNHFLAEVIKILRSVSGASTLMIYASDHGESLGENGLYLHGTPYALAPDVQKDIPYLVWMSREFKNKKSLVGNAPFANAHHAHETIFHSVMGAFDLRSEIYNPNLDIFIDVPDN